MKTKTLPLTLITRSPHGKSSVVPGYARARWRSSVMARSWRLAPPSEDAMASVSFADDARSGDGDGAPVPRRGAGAIAAPGSLGDEAGQALGAGALEQRGAVTLMRGRGLPCRSVEIEPGQCISPFLERSGCEVDPVAPQQVD